MLILSSRLEQLEVFVASSLAHSVLTSWCLFRSQSQTSKTPFDLSSFLSHQNFHQRLRNPALVVSLSPELILASLCFLGYECHPVVSSPRMKRHLAEDTLVRPH